MAQSTFRLTAEEAKGLVAVAKRIPSKGTGPRFTSGTSQESPSLEEAAHDLASDVELLDLTGMV